MLEGVQSGMGGVLEAWDRAMGVPPADAEPANETAAPGAVDMAQFGDVLQQLAALIEQLQAIIDSMTEQAEAAPPPPPPPPPPASGSSGDGGGSGGGSGGGGSSAEANDNARDAFYRPSVPQDDVAGEEGGVETSALDAPVRETSAGAQPATAPGGDNMTATSVSAVSGDGAPGGGDTIFDWQTSVGAGQTLGAGDVSHMGNKGFQVNQVIADDDNTFTVIPSTTGHEGMKVDYALQDTAREATMSATMEFSDLTEFDPDDPYDGMKAMGLGIGEGAYGGGNPDNSGSVRLMVRGGELVVYSYHNDKPGEWGEDTRTGIFVEPGQEFDVDLKMIANDAGQKNGGFELYVNGELAASRSDMAFTEDGSAIDAMLGHVFWGGSGPQWEANDGAALTVSDLEVTKQR